MSANTHTTIKSLPTKIEEIAMEIGAATSGWDTLSTSIHNTTGDPVWISADAVRPDDQRFVLDALDAFGLEVARNCYELATADGTSKVAFATRDPRGALHGVILMRMAAHTLAGRSGDRTISPSFARLLQRLALRLAGEPGIGRAPAGEHDGLPFTLYVQQLLKLRTSGRTRRYEVLLRAESPIGVEPLEAPREMIARAEDPASNGDLDRVVLTELCQWLADNRTQLEVDPAHFTVNLSTGALLSESFPAFVEDALHNARVNPRLLGLEVRESQCRKHPAAVLRLVALCEKIGSHIVIDDFTFHSDALPLLRQRPIKMVKIDPALTVAALKDKVAQAQVVAISQGCRVLGMHCVAKRIESPMARQWLTAIGVDFAQGYLLEGPLPITELSALRLTEPVRRA
jgi:EAL domain-containing protein (putative c-di-GMP-specific phosphodiesterase class I)